MTNGQSSAPPPWRAGLHSARTLLWPGLILQGVALSLVLAYYFAPVTQGLFARIGDWQRAGGYAFSAGATALCGGLLPFLFLRAQPATRVTHPWPHLVFFLLFWAYKGVEVDLWYHLLSRLYGSDHATGTVVAKILSDQLGYNVLWATPVSTLAFQWKAAGFRWGPVVADLRTGRWSARRVLPVLIAVWSVWIPVTACVYSLPGTLQMPLFNVVLCFWSLLFAYIVAHQGKKI